MSATETLGVDLGGTKMLLGVVGDEARALWESREDSADHSQEALVELIVREARQAREQHGDVAAIGMGVPASIDHDKGVALAAVNLPIENLPLRDLVAERAGLPAFLDNDANLAALAEQLYGAARGARNAVVLTIGTGIGGGLVLNGDLYRGSTGAGAELGHMVIEVDGPRCQGNCPNRGCVETLASGTALGREAVSAAEREPESALGRRLTAGETVDGEAATEAARAGDRTAVGVFDLIGSRLGVALANYANIFEPEVIVIGGGVAAAGDLLLDPARVEMRARALSPMDRTPVVLAKLGGDAGMIGAAAMARIELER